jgi:outer membrane immunogenic protein
MRVLVGLASLLICSAAMAGPAAAPVTGTWNGLYGGLNIGGIRVDDGPMTSTPANAATGTFWGPCATTGACPRDRAGNDDNGFIGGGQLGYNWQLQGFLVGVEGDIQGNSADSSRTVTRSGVAGFVPFTGTADTKIEWLSTLRGRVGVLVAPTVLAYATGGVAYAGIERKFSAQFSPASPASYSGKDEGEKFGWTVGGGLEWVIGDRVTLGAEYLYVDLDAKDQFTAAGTAGVGGCTTRNCIFTVQSSDLDMQIARLKLNFGF